MILRLTAFAPLMLCALAACAQREQALFVVLPNSDGTSGAVTVSDSRQSLVLDKPYAAGEERRDKIAAATSSPEQIQQISVARLQRNRSYRATSGSISSTTLTY